MKHLKLSLTDKNYYLLQRIAKADEIRNNALKLIKEDYKETEKNIIKENTLKEDTEYCLVNGTNKKSIVNGNTWNESEVKNND